MRISKRFEDKDLLLFMTARNICLIPLGNLLQINDFIMSILYVLLYSSLVLFFGAVVDDAEEKNVKKSFCYSIYENEIFMFLKINFFNDFLLRNFVETFPKNSQIFEKSPKTLNLPNFFSKPHPHSHPPHHTTNKNLEKKFKLLLHLSENANVFLCYLLL